MEANNVARGTFQMTVTNMVQYAVMGLFYIVVTKTNALSPADLGVLSILSFIASTLGLSTLSLPTALTKFVSEHFGRNESQEAASVHRTVTRTVVILSALGFVVTVLLSAPLADYFWGTTENSALIILMCFSAFLLNIITLYKSGLRALYLFSRMALVTIIYIVVSRVTAAILALVGLGVQGVTIGYIIGSLVGVVVALAFTRGKLSKPRERAPLGPLLHFSLPLLVSSLALLVIGQADIVILAAFTSDYALVGIYSIAVRSLMVLSVIWQPITVTIFPIVSARFGRRNPEGVSSALKLTSRYLSYTIIPSCVLLAAIAPTALEVFYGPSYVAGATALAIMAISVIIGALFALLTTTLTAIGKTRQVLQINLLSALATIGLLVGSVPLFDIIGAAFTRLAVQGLSLMVTVYTLRKHVAVRLDREALWKSLLASMMIVPVLFLLASVIASTLPTLQLLVVELLVAGSIYLASLYVLKALKGHDFDLLREALPKSLSKVIDVLEIITSRT